MKSLESNIAELRSQLEMRERTLIARQKAVKRFLTPEMDEFMIQYIGEQDVISEIDDLLAEIDDLVVVIEDEFGIIFNEREFRAVRRYIIIYLQTLDTRNEVEKALKMLK